MNQPSVLLQLDYADPPPPSDLAHRARAKGRHLRNRRHPVVGTGAAAVAALGAFAVIPDQFGNGLVDHNTQVADRPGARDLPGAVGGGPTAVSIIGSGSSDPTARWGASHVISRQRDLDDRFPTLYVTGSGQLCIGGASDEVAAVAPSACQELGRVPEGGFAEGLTSSNYGNVPSGVAAQDLVAGVVRGDVSSVVVATPSGVVEAIFAPAKDARLGQLYWAETPLTAPGGDQLSQIRRTAYRGTQALYGCAEAQCARQ